MAYLTQAALQVAVGGSVKLIQLTDDDGDGASDAAVIAQLIAEVDGYINSYVGKRYAVPLADPPAPILAIATAEGARRARRRRNMPLPDDIETGASDREWLEGVASGKVTLGVEPSPTKSELVVDTVGERDSTRNTTRENLKGIW